jgi:hypothetical protein
MSWAEAVLLIPVVVWLLGVGLLAHALPRIMAEDDFLSIAMGLEPERVSVAGAIAIVGWPVTLPVLWVMVYRKKRKDKG